MVIQYEDTSEKEVNALRFILIFIMFKDHDRKCSINCFFSFKYQILLYEMLKQP